MDTNHPEEATHSHPCQSLHIYPAPQHIVLTTLPVGRPNGAQARSYRITIRPAAYGFPRKHLVGNLANRGKGECSIGVSALVWCLLP